MDAPHYRPPPPPRTNTRLTPALYYPNQYHHATSATPASDSALHAHLSPSQTTRCWGQKPQTAPTCTAIQRGRGQGGPCSSSAWHMFSNCHRLSTIQPTTSVPDIRASSKPQMATCDNSPKQNVLFCYQAYPRWPEITRYRRHGACQTGRGHLLGRRRAMAAEGVYSFCPPAAVGTMIVPPSAARASAVILPDPGMASPPCTTTSLPIAAVALRQADRLACKTGGQAGEQAGGRRMGGRASRQQGA